MDRTVVAVVVVVVVEVARSYVKHLLGLPGSCSVSAEQAID
jgi:hypothetical protein